MGGVCSFFFGCCSTGTSAEGNGTTLVGARSCTDKLVLLAWLAAWGVSIAVISTAASQGGDPQKILNAIDYSGRICGYSPGVRDRPLGALLHPLAGDADALQAWTCVSDCSETKNTNNSELAAMYGSTNFFGYCLPTFDFGSSSVSVDFRVKSQFDGQFDSLSREVSRGIADLANAWEVILLSAGIALVCAYLYMWLTKRFAGVIIWLAIGLVVVGGFFVGYTFLREAAAAPPTSSSSRVTAYRVAGYVFIGATALFGLIILGLSGQIKLAIEVIKEASRAVNDMKAIVFFPLLPLLMAGAYATYWVYGALFIFSVGDRHSEPMPPALLTREDSLGTWAYYGAADKAGTPIAALANASLSTYEINDSFRPLAAWHVFHGLWSIQLLVYWGYFVLAGAVCAWYFSLWDENGKKKVGGTDGGSRTPLLASMWRSVRYHFGTIAFAALIIAVIQFARAVIKYVERKTRTDPPNYLHRAIFCILNCLLKCVECICDKVSKQALIWSAMYGDPFLASACASFGLLWRNLARVAAVHAVTNVVLLVGKLAIAAATVGLCALLLLHADPWRSQISSAFAPCLVIFFLAYSVAWLFFLTFETVADATFLCFLVDAENAQKKGEAMFASKGLQELVGKYQLRSAQQADKELADTQQLYQRAAGNKVAMEPEHVVVVKPKK